MAVVQEMRVQEMNQELISDTDGNVIKGSVASAIRAALTELIPGYQGKIVIKINIQINTANGGGATISV